MKGKRLVFLAPGCDNQHLMKEMGLFPFYLKIIHGFDAKVLTYYHGPYPYLDNELRDLKIEFLEKNLFRFFKTDFSILKYIFKNSKKIDFFCLKTLTRENLIYVFFYKFLNHYHCKYFGSS